MLNSMRLIFSLLLTFIFACVHAETVYKTVDEEGNIIFSDQPSADAEKIELKQLQTIKNPNPPQNVPPATQTKSEQPAAFYQAFSVVSPAEGEGYRSNNGALTIQLSLQPSLKRGHKVIIKMDGKTISSGKSLSVNLQNVDRGTHSISAAVVDADNKTLISTSSSFTMLRVAVAPRPAPR